MSNELKAKDIADKAKKLQDVQIILLPTKYYTYFAISVDRNGQVTIKRMDNDLCEASVILPPRESTQFQDRLKDTLKRYSDVLTSSIRELVSEEGK